MRRVVAHPLRTAFQDPIQRVSRDMTREQLAQQARNAEISGTSGLSKDELKQKLESEAGE